MPPIKTHRIPAVRTLAQLLPDGAEGAKEFARIVDLLLIYESRRQGQLPLLFDDAAGDFRGLDSASRDLSRRKGTTGFQYKFFVSPLSPAHRSEIEQSVLLAAKKDRKPKLRRWVLVTPEDFTESGRKTGGGDVSWFEALKDKHDLTFNLEHWGHKKLQALFLETPVLSLFYYPELVIGGQSRRKTIAEIRRKYDENLNALYREIYFVGMSVYKQEAARGVAIEDIYIPLTIVSAESDKNQNDQSRQDALALLEPGSKHVVLGDPGSGKSTLLRFLALAGTSPSLQARYRAKPDERLPIIVILRKYADELKTKADLSLLEYIKQNIQADFSLSNADEDFFEFYLESAQTIFFFDGLDELPSPHFKQIVRDRIKTLLLAYPGNSAIVTSRIVGYDEPFRFEKRQFTHLRIAPLRLRDMEQFVRDWCRARIENQADRKRNADDLLRIIKDDDHSAIRELAENPLLLTIIALVHRIDAVLPDERVVLYQKCTETLLNTWHTWKFKEAEHKNRGRVERRNRARMEAIAHWMQRRSVATGKSSRAVVPYAELHAFLSNFITGSERLTDFDQDARDSATEFLDFVKKRAGLLIEAGDEQYSFVHLTFQEYLTATYIITTNEVTGASGIWATISEYAKDSRWHEVIRLLIGDLKSPASQGTILSKLLAANQSVDKNLSELLGGFVLDGIEPAEQHLGEILDQVLAAASRCTSRYDCERLVRIVRAWRSKDSFSESILNAAFARFTKQNTRAVLKGILLAVACGVDYMAVETSAKKAPIVQEQALFLNAFFGAGAQEPFARDSEQALDRLFMALAVLLLKSSDANTTAAQLQGIFAAFGYDSAAKYWFHLLLTSFIGGLPNGPFYEFVQKTREFSRVHSPYLARLSARSNRMFGEQAPDRRKWIVTGPLGRALYRFWSNGHTLEGLPVTTVIETTEDLLGQVAWRATRILRRRLQEMPGGPAIADLLVDFEYSGTAGLVGYDPYGEASLTNQVLDLLVISLGLSPGPQWGCALAYRFIPGMSVNPWPASPETQDRLIAKFGMQMHEESDYYCLAWYLLFHSWGVTFEKAAQPLSHELVDIAESSPHPAVRIAYAIWQLSVRRIDNDNLLVQLFADRECKKLMRKSGWVPKIVSEKISR